MVSGEAQQRLSPQGTVEETHYLPLRAPTSGAFCCVHLVESAGPHLPSRGCWRNMKNQEAGWHTPGAPLPGLLLLRILPQTKGTSISLSQSLVRVNNSPLCGFSPPNSWRHSPAVGVPARVVCLSEKWPHPRVSKELIPSSGFLLTRKKVGRRQVTSN